MADTQQPVNSPFSKYTKLEMKKSSNEYLGWIVGIALLIIAGVVFWVIK